MFAGDAAAAAAGVEELNAALQWVEGELAKGEGPFFMGKDFTLVSSTARPSFSFGWRLTHPPVPQFPPKKKPPERRKGRSVSPRAAWCVALVMAAAHLACVSQQQQPQRLHSSWVSASGHRPLAVCMAGVYVVVFHSVVPSACRGTWCAG